jgi:single-stranded-DNA-specific exonuclease
MTAETISVSGRPWRYRQIDEELALAISQRHGLPQILGQLLAARGIGLDAVPSFIEPRLRDWLPDPSHLLDLDVAARRLAQAILDAEPIGIIGDYDVDGATSTALLARYLRAFGIEAAVEIPDRLGEGYGASPEAFDRLAEAGCRLCLTLDNGTTAFEALAAAAAAGQEVIVVDHHAAEDRLPAALGVINPNRLDQASPLTHLAAVGVVFVLLVAVNRELRRLGGRDMALPDPLRWLDLVALGTVCDVVPLTGLNRAFVRQGLRIAGMTPLAGLAALAGQAGIARVGDVWQLGFALGPRINAASRLGEQLLGPRLLMTDDAGEAQAIAGRLDELNQQRQALERQIVAAAEESVQSQLQAGRQVLFAMGEGWHAGVIGIVASRLVERHQRPVFVLAAENGVAKGSARSVRGFDLGACVIAARQAGLLERGGGHAMAAGLTIRTEKLDAFQDFAQERMAAADHVAVAAGKALELDGTISAAGVTALLAADLEKIGPYGPGHVEPRFCLSGARLVDLREVGDGHLACVFAGITGRVRTIAFRCRETAVGAALRQGGDGLKLAGRIKADRWNGELRASFQIDDVCLG